MINDYGWLDLSQILPIKNLGILCVLEQTCSQDVTLSFDNKGLTIGSLDLDMSSSGRIGNLSIAPNSTGYWK